MVETIKFSEFADGGDLSNDEITVGLGSGTNTKFNNPWTFLPPGTTGDRPVPTPSIYFRLRFNTTLEVYEYYDPTTLTWTQLSGSGTGTVNPGVANDLAFYAVNGQIISPINGANNSVLVTNGLGVPSLSTTLPTGLSIPGATITSSTAALLSGSVVAAPVAGIDIANKAYVDAQVGGTVLSITGTANQVIASSPTGNVTLSLPQDIAVGSTPTFLGLTLTAIPLGVSSGGTGLSSYTANGILFASGTTTIGQISPVNSAVLVTNSGGVPALSSTMTNGQIIIGSTGGTPTVANLTAGANISITNGAGSITITATGLAGFSWTTVTGTSQAMLPNNGYIANNAGLVTLSLPATSVVGDEIDIIGKGAGGWKVQCGGGQTIVVGSSTTTSGGSVASTQAKDSFYMICTVANTEWTVASAPQSGGLTIA